MPLKAITTIQQPPRYEVEAGGFYAIHDGTKILEPIAELKTKLNTGRKIIAADTRDELNAEIARLKLTPFPKTKLELVAEYFATLSAALQTKWSALLDFAKLEAMPTDAARASFFSAFKPGSDEETTAQKAIIALFS